MKRCERLLTGAMPGPNGTALKETQPPQGSLESHGQAHGGWHRGTRTRSQEVTIRHKTSLLTQALQAKELQVELSMRPSNYISHKSNKAPKKSKASGVKSGDLQKIKGQTTAQHGTTFSTNGRTLNRHKPSQACV